VQFWRLHAIRTTTVKSAQSYLGLVCLVRDLVGCVLDWLGDYLCNLMLSLFSLVLEVIKLVTGLVLCMFSRLLCLVLGVIKPVLIILTMLCLLVLNCNNKMSAEQKRASVRLGGQQHLGLVDGQSNGKDSSSSSSRLDQQTLLLLIT